MITVQIRCFAGIPLGVFVETMPDGSVCQAGHRNYFIECLNYDANEFDGADLDDS